MEREDRSDQSAGTGESDVEELYVLSSDELPELTSSEHEQGLDSTDSGRSDTWAYTGGILRGVRRIRECDVENGIATVTGPLLDVVDGFTSDGVVDLDTSEHENSPPLRIPVSSTSDEGVESCESWRVYIDDEVLMGRDNGDRNEDDQLIPSSDEELDNGRNVIAGISDQDESCNGSVHGMPGIACTEDNFEAGHGGPGIACIENNVSDDNFEAGHGGLGIACIENDACIGNDDNFEAGHGGLGIARNAIVSSTDHGESSNGYSHGKPGIACIEDNFDACHRMPSVVSSDANFEVPVQEVMGYGHAGRLLQWIREESFDINMGDDPGF